MSVVVVLFSADLWFWQEPRYFHFGEKNMEALDSLMQRESFRRALSFANGTSQ